jgi:hypothetical protein
MYKRWEQIYADAMLEIDERKLENRIDTAVTVLGASLQELGESPQEMREKQAIEDGLRTLRLLRKELVVTTDEHDTASEQRRAG